MNVSLGEKWEQFVEGKVNSGDYQTASEVVRAGLRLLEREEKALQALRAAIDEGLNSPESEDVDGEEFMAQLISSVERPA